MDGCPSGYYSVPVFDMCPALLTPKYYNNDPQVSMEIPWPIVFLLGCCAVTLLGACVYSVCRQKQMQRMQQQQQQNQVFAGQQYQPLSNSAFSPEVQPPVQMPATAPRAPMAAPPQYAPYLGQTVNMTSAPVVLPRQQMMTAVPYYPNMTGMQTQQMPTATYPSLQ
jgi:hypothetical protein